MAENTMELEKKNEEEKKKKNKRKLFFNRVWRVINWIIVIWLANSALWKVQSWLKTEHLWTARFVFFVISVGFATVMVMYAEGTSHDALRRRSAWITAILSEGIMLLPFLKDTVLIALMDLGNLITVRFGEKVFNVDNYTSSDLGPLWWVNLIFAVVVVASTLREEQSTDNNLGPVRTPQKKEIIDLVKDDNVIGTLRKYKQ